MVCAEYHTLVLQIFGYTCLYYNLCAQVPAAYGWQDKVCCLLFTDLRTLYKQAESYDGFSTNICPQQNTVALIPSVQLIYG